MQTLQDMDMQIVTADQDINYGGNSNDQAVGTPVPNDEVKGQELSLRQPNEIAVAETPQEKTLKKQVSELVQALNFEEQVVHQKVHEMQVDAGTKVRQILKDQQDRFHRVATEYEEHARDVTTKEVAEARADVHGQAISAINDRERRIHEDSNWH